MNNLLLSTNNNYCYLCKKTFKNTKKYNKLYKQNLSILLFKHLYIFKKPLITNIIVNKQKNKNVLKNLLGQFLITVFEPNSNNE